MIKNAHINADNVVTWISRDSVVLPGAIDATHMPVDTGWTWNGTSFVPPPVDIEVLRHEAEKRIENLIDEYAVSWGYTSIYTAATYIPSKIPKFANEAYVLVDWRDSVWNFVEQHQNEYNDVESLIADLPAPPIRP